MVTTQPTYKVEGVKTYTCSRCNGTYTEAIPVKPPKIGDVDGDGLVNVKDLTLLKKYLASTVTIDDIVDVNSNIDGEDGIGVKDARALKLMIAG